MTDEQKQGQLGIVASGARLSDLAGCLGLRRCFYICRIRPERFDETVSFSNGLYILETEGAIIFRIKKDAAITLYSIF